MIRPQLLSLRNRVTNANRWPHLIHLRMSACRLHRMTTGFSKTSMKEKK